MAFGVKWNETGKENDCEPAEGRAASPEVRGRRAPGADPAVGCECGGCTPRPETPSSDSAPDRTGRGGGGGTEPSAIFPYSPKHTDTLPGRRLGVEQSPAPPPAPRAPAPPEAQGREPGSPRPGLRPRREEPRTRKPPRPPPLPSPRSSCWPRKSASSWRCWLLTARHRRLLLRSKTRGGDNQGSVPGQGRPWVHPRPKGDGRQSVSRDRRRRDRGAAQRHRNSLLAAPALQQRWPRPPPPPPLLSRRRPSSPFSPRAEALSERRRAPGCAFLLRHLLLLLLPQWRLHLPLVAASVPAPGLLALLRLAPSTRRPAKHRAQKRPPPARPVS